MHNSKLIFIFLTMINLFFIDKQQDFVSLGDKQQ